MKTLHPALELFKRLFDEYAQDPGPVLPTYFVPRCTFIAAVKKSGIDCPKSESAIDWFEWEDSIGLQDFAHKIFVAYHKAHGSDFTPMEKGAWRLRNKQRRQRMAESKYNAFHR